MKFGSGRKQLKGRWGLPKRSVLHAGFRWFACPHPMDAADETRHCNQGEDILQRSRLQWTAAPQVAVGIATLGTTDQWEWHGNGSFRASTIAQLPMRKDITCISGSQMLEWPWVLSNREMVWAADKLFPEIYQWKWCASSLSLGRSTLERVDSTRRHRGQWCTTSCRVSGSCLKMG